MPLALLAVLIGSLALLAGLALLLEPLLLPELSRPRDALWAAVVLLLGLVLVTAAERLQGAPMLGVLCGGLLVGRLGTEVGQQRWRQLPADERLQLQTVAHWQRRALDLAVAVSRAVGLAGALLVWVAQRSRRPVLNKRWVRADLPAAAMPVPGPEPEQEPAPGPDPETPSEPERAVNLPQIDTGGAADADAEVAGAGVAEAAPPVGDFLERDILESDFLKGDILDAEVEELDREELDHGPGAPAAVPTVRVIVDLGEVDALLDAADG